MKADGLPLLEPPGVLGRIVAQTLQDLAKRQSARPLHALQAHLRDSPEVARDFAQALRGAPGEAPRDQGALPGLIAEFKPRSPSRGDIRPGASPQGVATIYRDYAAAISVLCDRPFFGGGHDKLAEVRAAAPQPVLCKDFIVTRYQIFEARAAGADAVLLMASLLPRLTLQTLHQEASALGMAALVETHDARELETAMSIDAPIVGVNSRDLHTLKINTERAWALLDQIPADRVRVAESGLHSAEDVHALAGRADAALVGSALMGAPDIAARVEAMGWTSCA